jgi:predicted PurR-regulated permease PerM
MLTDQPEAKTESTMNSQPSIKAYDWTNRQVITATLFIVAVVTLFGLLYQFRLAVFILLVGVVLGTAIHPAVEALTRRGVPKSAAVAALFFVLLLAIGGVLMLVVPLLANQAADIAGSVPEYYSQLRQTMVTSPNIFLHRLAFRLPETLSMSAPPPIEADETVLTQASTFFNFMRVTLQSILLTLAAFLISFYWTLESRRIIQQGLLYAPMKQRENIRSFLQAIEEKVGGYVRGQGILCLAIGLLSFV